MKISNVQADSAIKEIRKHENLKGFKFAWAMKRNIEKLQSGINKNNKLKKYMTDKEAKEWNAYEAERVELAKEMSEKDKNGNPTMDVDPLTNGKSYKVEDVEKFNKEWDIIKKKHKTIVDKYNEIANFNNGIDARQKFDFTPHKIKIEDVPNEMSLKEYEVLQAFIYDPEDEKETVTEEKPKVVTTSASVDKEVAEVEKELTDEKVEEEKQPTA